MQRVYEEGSAEYGAAMPWSDIKQYQRDRCATLARAALEAAAPHMTQPVIHDVDWALTVLQKCGIETADQFAALVTLQKLTP